MKKRQNKKLNLVLLVVFAILVLVLIVVLISPKIKINKIAIVELNGPIGMSASPFSTSMVTADETIQFLEQAEADPTIKAIILEINSPGGTVLASKEIANKVKSINKPVVAWIRDLGASGAYWIASASDKIVADEMSITGSVGVISGFFEFSKLFEEYGIKYEEIKGGEYKNLGSSFKELTPEERAILQQKIDLIHEHFTKAVMENRNLDSDAFANGLFYLGIEAKELGLVDYLGGKATAITVAEQLAGIEKSSIVKFEKEKTLLESLAGISENSFFMMGKGISEGLTEANSDLLPTA